MNILIASSNHMSLNNFKREDFMKLKSLFSLAFDLISHHFLIDLNHLFCNRKIKSMGHIHRIECYFFDTKIWLKYSSTVSVVHLSMPKLSTSSSFSSYKMRVGSAPRTYFISKLGNLDGLSPWMKACTCG